MTSSIDEDIRNLYRRIFNADEKTLPIDELILKNDKIKSVQRFYKTFNNDAEVVRDTNGRIVAYKGHSFKQA